MKDKKFYPWGPPFVLEPGLSEGQKYPVYENVAKG